MTAPAQIPEAADDSSVTPNPVIETEDERKTRLSVYHEIKRLLVAEGIPEHEIAFVHDYEGPAAMAELSRKLNAGEIRIVLASTTKLGVGANIQQRLYAIHHGDPPWVPASIEQRDGRMLRQGNIYPEVHICQYVTEGSFDAYSWQLLENKSRFISQVMRGESPARVAEDVDLAVLTASQIKAIASGNPLVLEKVGFETELTRLDRLYATWRAGRNRLRYDLAMLPEKIGKAEADLRAHAAAIEVRDRNLPGGAEAGRRGFAIELRRSATGDETITFTERELAGNQIRQLVSTVEREALKYGSATRLLGEYAGFEIYASAACLNVARDLSKGLFGQASLYLRLKDHRVEYGFNLTDSDAGIIQSMDARLRSIDKRLAEAEETRRRLIDHRARIEAELAKGWEYATKYQELRARLDALNASMRVEGLTTEDPLHLAELAEEAFLSTASEPSGVPAVAPGVEPAAASVESAVDDQNLQIEPAIPATSEYVVPVPASPEETVDHQSQEPRIEAAVTTATGNGVEESPAIEAGAARTTTDWDELFARREQIKAEREKRPRPKRRAASHSSAQLSFDWS
ncbi:MAG TPA: hypothetical protein VE715_10770 [Blastocatellia bacterium]|nr:hypothetical protein [Blastocatellia bacterium]